MSLQGVGGCSPAHQAAKLSAQASLHREALAWVQDLGLTAPRAAGGAIWADLTLLGRVADVVQAARRGERAHAAALPPPPARHSQSRRTFRDRINDYIRFQQLCQELGVRRELLPPLADLEQGQGGADVCACLQELAQRAAAAGLQVPRFGDPGSRGRDGARGAMSREASAKRAELFRHEGESPPKLPALNKLLTPRAFQGKPSSPTIGAVPAALRSSNGGLPTRLHSGSSKVEQEEQQQQEQPRRGLGSTVAALEQAAAEAAEAARLLQSQQRRSQRPRRPVLPPLDVAAAAAMAAAEASSDEEEEEGEGGGGGAAVAGQAWGSPLSSALSSPATSSYASPCGAGYSSSSAYASSAASPVVALTPSRLQQRAQTNPLWNQSPQPQPPSPAPAGWASAHAAAPPAGSARGSSAAGLRGGAGGLQAAAAAAQQERRARVVEEGEEEDGALRGSLGGGDGLLESLLSPPEQKPRHVQLLGALMHTRTAGSRGQPQQRAEEEAELEEPPASAQAAEAAEPAAQQHASQHPQTEQAVAAAAETSSSTASQGGSGNGGNSGVRKLALVLLGAAAGAAVVLAAGMGHQDARRRLHPAPKPRQVPMQRSSRRAERPQPQGGGGASAAPLSWDSPHVITRG